MLSDLPFLGTGVAPLVSKPRDLREKRTAFEVCLNSRLVAAEPSVQNRIVQTMARRSLLSATFLQEPVDLSTGKPRLSRRTGSRRSNPWTNMRMELINFRSRLEKSSCQSPAAGQVLCLYRL